ncbi:hypothetical protein BHM03_00010117 [Ensete ventricosum]|nr:hypothetical protein BHM03_00010117 [Ensete ventricosum]
MLVCPVGVSYETGEPNRVSYELVGVGFYLRLGCTSGRYPPRSLLHPRTFPLLPPLLLPSAGAASAIALVLSSFPIAAAARPLRGLPHLPHLPSAPLFLPFLPYHRLLAVAAATTHCRNLLPITTHRFTSPLPSPSATSSSVGHRSSSPPLHHRRSLLFPSFPAPHLPSLPPVVGRCLPLFPAAAASPLPPLLCCYHPLLLLPHRCTVASPPIPATTVHPCLCRWCCHPYLPPTAPPPPHRCALVLQPHSRYHPYINRSCTLLFNSRTHPAIFLPTLLPPSSSPTIAAAACSRYPSSTLITAPPSPPAAPSSSSSLCNHLCHSLAQLSPAAAATPRRTPLLAGPCCSHFFFLAGPRCSSESAAPSLLSASPQPLSLPDNPNSCP